MLGKTQLVLLMRLLGAFKEHKQLGLLRALTARALNCFLVRTPKEQISIYIKLSLPTLIH